MQVHHSIDRLPQFTRAVVTIGTFDGVHLGHRKIIDSLLDEARLARGESVLVSFFPHPKKIVQPAASLEMINTQEEKIDLLAKTGIDHLVIVPFTEKFSNQQPSDYIADFLVGLFHPHTIIIGYDHHFGKDRKGDFMTLASSADQYGYRLLEIPKYILDENAVSSTKIRTALRQSDIDTANHLLGYVFFFQGTVIHGDKLGRELGYPTANLRYDDEDKIHLGHGVYAVDVHIGDEIRKGMLSIGNRPTLHNSEEKVEVNIFDWDKDIYGEVIRVDVKHYLRPQEKYPTLDALKQQLSLDKEAALRF